MKTLVSDAVAERLDAIQKQFGVEVIYACESGSRAWGFASSDSDYDVRFIYAHPTEKYLSVSRKPITATIEVPIVDEFDVAGWDLTKALELLGKSNPPLLEWLQSPTVYRENKVVIPMLKALMPMCYSPISCFYHYLHMANGNFRKYLGGETVQTKKYLYVLRPVLACNWIESGRGTVPTEMGKLVEAQVPPGALLAEIRNLLDRKASGDELGMEPRNETLHSFLGAELARLEKAVPPPQICPNYAEIDATFVRMLVSLWGHRIAGA